MVRASLGSPFRPGSLPSRLLPLLHRQLSCYDTRSAVSSRGPHPSSECATPSHSAEGTHANRSNRSSLPPPLFVADTGRLARPLNRTTSRRVPRLALPCTHLRRGLRSLCLSPTHLSFHGHSSGPERIRRRSLRRPNRRPDHSSGSSISRRRRPAGWRRGSPAGKPPPTAKLRRRAPASLCLSPAIKPFCRPYATPRQRLPPYDKVPVLAHGSACSSAG